MKRAKLNELQAALKDQFASELEGLKNKKMGLKPKQIEDLKAGFSDGLRSMIHGLVTTGHLIIVDE